MPCELTDGVSLLVEMFYQPSQDVRRYGGDNYGEGFYGNSNTGEPEPPYWVDLTRFCTYVSVQRGDLQPRIGQNTDQISIELMDNYGDVYGWQGDISFSSPQFNTPVRVSLVESDQITTHIVATGRLDDVIERFGPDSSFARIIEFRAYGQKTSLISSLLGEERPIEFVDDRIDAVLTAIGYPDPVQAYPAAFSTVRLRGDLDTRVEDDAIAYVIIAQAAASAGYAIGTNAAGEIIWNQISEPAQAPLFTIAECGTNTGRLSLVPYADRGPAGLGAWSGVNDATAPVWIDATDSPNGSPYIRSSRSAGGTGIAICALSLPFPYPNTASVGMWMRADQPCTLAMSMAFYLGGGWQQENSQNYTYDPSDGWVWITNEFAPSAAQYDTVQLRARINNAPQGTVYDWTDVVYAQDMTPWEPVDAISGIYTEATYQAGIDRVLNVVQLQNVVDPAAGAEAVDVVSVSKWGRRSQGFGMPIIVANDSQADAQGVADAILATTANIINRVADITFNTLTDHRWYGIFQSLDIDLWLDVQRSSPNPSNFTGEIIGLDFDIIPNEGITGTVHLSTRDETF